MHRAPVWRILRILAAHQISVIVKWSKRETSVNEPAFTTIALKARSAARALRHCIKRVPGSFRSG